MDTKKLRQKILDLAIHGKLVPQDPNDEPASVLLERIRAEKERLIAEGKIKRSKKSATSDTSHYENVPFEVPEGWCWCRLDCVGEIVTGSTPSKDNADYYGGSIPFYKPTDLEQGINTIEASDSLTELGFSVSRQLPDLSILVTCIGATIGKTGLIQKRGTCNQQINAIISNDMVLPEYLYYTCISGYMQSEIIGRASATTLPILNKNKFSEIPIPVPPIQEQQRIISKIETLFSFVIELENSDKELIISISIAKSKILDLAIHGKLVPQDSNDEPALDLLKRVNPKAVASCDNPHYENIPSSWICTTMGSIFQHNTGKALNKSASTEGALLPYLTTSNVYWNTFDLSVVKEMRFKESEIEKCTIRKGDLLICEGGDIGRAAIWDKDYSICIQNHLHRLRPKGDVVPLLYLYYIMYLKLSNNLEGKGIGLQGFSSGLLDKLEVPLPPYNEQIRIVDKIRETFNMLDSIAESLN